jgi:hypothetical protein
MELFFCIIIFLFLQHISVHPYNQSFLTNNGAEQRFELGPALQPASA